MSTGTGSTGGGGAGYRVEVDNLRAFASQVRGLLKEFQASADGSRVHGASGVRSDAFGNFAEAQALHESYVTMCDRLRQVLDTIHAAIDEAQHKADMTASNYEEQENETSRTLKVSGDGWSVGTPPAGTAVYSPTTTVGRTMPASAAKPSPVTPAVPPAAAPTGSGDPKPTW